MQEDIAKETIRNMNEDKIVKDFLKDINLQYAYCEGLGDCCVQACMKKIF